MSDLIERVEAARRFPTNTCPASRHAARIGEALVRGKPYPMLTEESAHCGESILSAVASLWEARTEIERLTDENGRLRADLLAGRNVVNAGMTIHTLTLERDELRRQLAEAWAQREAMANVLPGYYYMDPPDGGDVSVLEQLRRMAKDAQRYRWLRANREFCVATYPEGEWVIPAGMVFLGYSNPDADSWIDAAMGGGDAE